MIDLETARQAYWENGRGAITYQAIWQEMRRSLANVYHNVISGSVDLKNEDDTVTLQAFGVVVGRFEIK
jgi:hypothetical protein